MPRAFYVFTPTKLIFVSSLPFKDYNLPCTKQILKYLKCNMVKALMSFIINFNPVLCSLRCITIFFAFFTLQTFNIDVNIHQKHVHYFSTDHHDIFYLLALPHCRRNCFVQAQSQFANEMVRYGPLSHYGPSLH